MASLTEAQTKRFNENNLVTAVIVVLQSHSESGAYNDESEFAGNPVQRYALRELRIALLNYLPPASVSDSYGEPCEGRR